MAESKTTGAQLRAYLLGLLAEPDHAEIEELLFHDDGFSAKLELAEDELIEDYFNDRLSIDERINFDRYFQSSRKRSTLLKVAEAVRSYSLVESAISVVRPERSRWSLAQWFPAGLSRFPGWLPATVGFAVVAACFYLGFSIWQQQRDSGVRPIAPSVAGGDRKNPVPPRESERTSPVEPSRPVATSFALVLTPGLFRGPAGSTTGGKVFQIPISVDSVLITLVTEAPVSGGLYRVTMTREERVVWQGKAALTAGVAKSDRVQVKVPSSVLNTGEYSLTVFEGPRTDPDSGLYDYSLTVRRK